MQKIFSQELRFKDENGDEYLNWKTSQLGEITKHLVVEHQNPIIWLL